MAHRLYRKRLTTGFNAVIAVALAAVLVVMVNYLSYKHGFRMDFSQSRYLTLSPRTAGLLEHLTADVDIIVFLSSSHDLYRDMRQLLKEYEHASDRIHVDTIDPNRDLARTKELALKYDITEPNVVVFDSGGRKKIVSVKEFADYDYSPMESGYPKKMTAFRGEQILSSAIQSLTQVRKPKVYFLAGHGERRIDHYDQYAGYSIIARTLHRENMDVQTLTLGDVSSILKDCDALIIAGPTKQLTRSEVDMIKAFLDDAGRLFVLLDPGVTTGLESLLEAWGVQLAEDRVVGLTLTGRELLVTGYGEHPITACLRNVRSFFYLPRSIEPLVSGEWTGEKLADKPRVTVLASSSEQGWAEMSPDQNPPIFNSDVDRIGPISVAVAVEKGSLRGMDVEIKPTRMVVVGDSAMASNGAILAGCTPDFFISCLNWLIERQGSLNIISKKPPVLHVVMTRGQIRSVYWIIVVAIPAAVAGIGFGVWVMRRK